MSYNILLSQWTIRQNSINISLQHIRAEKNGHHFADDIYKYIILSKNVFGVWNFAHYDPIDIRSALVQEAFTYFTKNLYLCFTLDCVPLPNRDMENHIRFIY